mmetsp:Transcript_17700/g.24383  ORF Transcript_17700/g.24383 Transcript_17700/m.24383 type:complete len:202 (+) Transcript_17700:555-1160(+)
MKKRKDTDPKASGIVSSGPTASHPSPGVWTSPSSFFPPYIAPYATTTTIPRQTLISPRSDDTAEWDASCTDDKAIASGSTAKTKVVCNLFPAVFPPSLVEVCCINEARLEAMNTRYDPQTPTDAETLATYAAHAPLSPNASLATSTYEDANTSFPSSFLYRSPSLLLSIKPSPISFSSSPPSFFLRSEATSKARYLQRTKD